MTKQPSAATQLRSLKRELKEKHRDATRARDKVARMEIESARLSRFIATFAGTMAEDDGFRAQVQLWANEIERIRWL